MRSLFYIICVTDTAIYTKMVRDNKYRLNNKRNRLKNVHKNVKLKTCVNNEKSFYIEEGDNTLSRLNVTVPGKAEQIAESLYKDIERRAAGGPVNQCPVDLMLAFLRLSHAQTCGKCVPCRVGLTRIADMLEAVLNGTATMATVKKIKDLAQTITDSADCAIGYQAADMVLRGVANFADDFKSHIEKGICTCSTEQKLPCVSRCPASVDIPGYIALAGEGRYADAVRLIRKDNPFPTVCAYVCEHPCEHHCRRNIIDDAVNIRGIKKYAVDNAGVVEPPKPMDKTGKKVAVIGGGPAGLTATYFLGLMGHDVTVYEQRKSLGGMLRYGIPSYRLPRERLQLDIDACLYNGAKVITDISVGKDISLEQLREEYDAVYISIGAHADKKLGIEGENSRGVISAVEMLRSIGDEVYPDFNGKKVIVVGGGNVAMDCCRSAVRLGAESVSVAYRRRQSDMTALAEEVEGAIAEGCEMLTLQAPVRVEADEEGNVKALWVQPQMIGQVDRAGRPRPVKADAPEKRLEADIIIVAIGQNIESDYFGEKGLPLKWDTLNAKNDLTFAEMEGVFAGGDCVSGPATVIRAIEAGKVAAANIDNYLGYNHEINCDVEIPAPRFADQPACGRVNMTEREASERKHDFVLCEGSMSEQELKQEAGRCLQCDHYGYGCFRGGREVKW